MSLKEIYQSQITAYSNQDLEWVQYVRDHFAVLVKSAVKQTLEPYQHYAMTYRLEDWLGEQNIPKEMAWIVLYINQLSDASDFKELTEIMIPNLTLLEQLKQQFKTVQSQKKAVQSKT